MIEECAVKSVTETYFKVIFKSRDFDLKEKLLKSILFLFYSIVGYRYSE